ncbi:MAG: prenyltransferase/squalene oxidase repeat-containing protein [Candidatus Aminicenantales bacterium]|jgi:hypothetical protein
MTAAPENAALIKRLSSLSLAGGGVPYYKGGGPSAEPALQALLALSVSSAPAEISNPLLTWATKLQNSDGSIAINPVHRDQGLWLTALAAVVFHKFGLKDARDRALGFVVSLKSVTIPNDPRVRQNNLLTGWPWVPGTFGWVEPTAWSLVALNVCGLGGHPRATEGRAFLLDREILSGGWNYGNPGLNDRELLPFWDTTGLALIALHGQVDVDKVRASLDLLDKNQEKIDSPCGLAWAAMGLETYGRDVARLKMRLFSLLSSLPEDTLNAAHLAVGLIALSGRKVFVA